MGLLTRLRRIMSANVNDLIDKAENPEKMAKQLIREMEDSIREVKANTATAMANHKKLERKREENAGEVKLWEERAVTALEKEDEELAREALKRKRIYAELQESFAQQVASQERTVATLKASLEALYVKLDEAKARSKVLIARSQRARTQKKVQKMVDRAVDTSAFSEFERLAERVEDEEVEVAAAAELDVDDLERKFAKEEEDADVEFELQELKERLAAGAEGAPEQSQET
ncbi:MAG: PspA/IM30 family protein [Armatimonadota bacterium]